jgi:F-type H+-transporting ATPase subunit gamma
MARYREIRSRIKGVESTAKITSAMKMVAAAKLRRAQDAIIAARPYGAKLRELLRFLASTTDTENLFFEEREVKRVALIVVAADRGLCGAFNSNLLRATVRRINSEYGELHDGGNVDLFCIGKRSVDFFRRSAFNVVESYPGVFSDLQFSLARSIVERVTAGFQEGEYDRVELVFNEFKSVVSQRVAFDQFLPVPKIDTKSPDAEPIQFVDYIFEPSVDELLAALLPRHLNTQLWNALLESNAAEQGARMTAMENATRNAKDLIRDLRLSYNKARQNAITTEILEIVSGAEALKKG